MQKNDHFLEENFKNQSAANCVKILNIENIEVQAIQWLWEGWLPLGKLTILAGAGGCGKTNLSLALISTITTGGFFPRWFTL